MGEAKQRVLVPFETAWDRKQIAACGPAVSERHDFIFSAPNDVDCGSDFDVLAFIDEQVRAYGASPQGRFDGVLSASDYPGATVAAAIATALGLPGARPEAVLRASHKFYSRVAQQAAAPEATPPFGLVFPDRPESPIGYPCFVKPVKGAFSVLSRKVTAAPELAAFLDAPAARDFSGDYMAIFDALVARYTDFEVGGGAFIVEGFLNGRQATVEGFAVDGEVEILGVVDSIFHPATGSFARFDYPSTIHPEAQATMIDVVTRVVRALGLDRSFFNVEMIYEASTDSVMVIEVNPRLCGQFGDLYAKVDGRNGYELALELATGGRPKLRRGEGAYAMATSFPMRIFDRVRVTSAPTPDDVAAAEALAAGTLVWAEYAVGDKLADLDGIEDGWSARYAVINVGADSRRELMARRDAAAARLGYAFEPLPPRASS